jgi:predicted RNA-binding Zn-ribbon protein involved in translation (DUF1610 family)
VANESFFAPHPADRRFTPRGVLHQAAGWIKLQCSNCGSAFVSRLPIEQSNTHYECLSCGHTWTLDNE